MRRQRWAGCFAFCVAGTFAGAISVGPVAEADVNQPNPGEICQSEHLAYASFLSDDRDPDGKRVVSELDGRGRYTPVIMVHGWTARSTHTPGRTGAFSGFINLTSNTVGDADVPRSFIGQVQNLPGSAVYTFDYHDYSARWVTDQQLGGALGASIDCLYEATQEQVILVGHSMGGLVARWALTHEGPGGQDRSTEVSTLVTFGTPNTGSDVAAALGFLAAQGGNYEPSSMLDNIRLILATCGQLSGDQIRTGTLCDWLPGAVRAFGSPAGKALQTGSPELQRLGEPPPSVNVVSLAGGAIFQTFKSGFFHFPWEYDEQPMGDLIVATDSATAHSERSLVDACTYQLNPVKGEIDDVAVGLQIQPTFEEASQPLAAFTGACFHPNLMRSIRLTNEAMGTINDDLQARAEDNRSSQIWAIAPGTLGPLTIGMSGAEATTTGLVERSTDSMCDVKWTTSGQLIQRGFSTEFRDDDDDDLDIISVGRPWDDSLAPLPVRTQEGVKLGTSVAMLKRVYGDRLTFRVFPAEGDRYGAYTLFGPSGALMFAVDALSPSDDGEVTAMHATRGTSMSNLLPFFGGC